jgi:hypothetical protein
MTRAGLIVACAVISSVAQAQDRAAIYQLIERRCEALIQGSPDDMANLGALGITLPNMCQCIASTVNAKLLDSEVTTLQGSGAPPPRVDALWTAARGFCAVTLRPKS